MAYVTRATLKSWARIPGSDTVDDVEIDAVLDAVTAQIRRYCGRDFSAASGTPAARVYAADSNWEILVDDFKNVTGFVLKTDAGGDGTYETTWSSTDYQAEPLNSKVAGETSPLYRIRAVGNYTFPVSREALVQVTADWGWAAVPDAVEQATLIQSSRILMRRDTPQGVLGLDGLGATVRLSGALDIDVQAMLAPYRRADVVIGLA